MAGYYAGRAMRCFSYANKRDSSVVVKQRKFNITSSKRTFNIGDCTFSALVWADVQMK